MAVRPPTLRAVALPPVPPAAAQPRSDSVAKSKQVADLGEQCDVGGRSFLSGSAETVFGQLIWLDDKEKTMAATMMKTTRAVMNAPIGRPPG